MAFIRLHLIRSAEEDSKLENSVNKRQHAVSEWSCMVCGIDEIVCLCSPMRISTTTTAAAKGAIPKKRRNRGTTFTFNLAPQTQHKTEINSSVPNARFSNAINAAVSNKNIKPGRERTILYAKSLNIGIKNISSNQITVNF